jgi:hypothetical protein
MSEHSRLVALNTGRSRPLQCVVAVVAATLFIVLVAPAGSARADGQRSSVVARIEARSAGLTSRDIVESRKRERACDGDQCQS